MDDDDDDDDDGDCVLFVAGRYSQFASRATSDKERL